MPQTCLIGVGLNLKQQRYNQVLRFSLMWLQDVSFLLNS